MNYLHLLQYFCIKHRVTFSSGAPNQIEEILKTSLNEEQYATIKEILEDNAKLSGKSPISDLALFQSIKARHLKRLKEMGVEDKEILKNSPQYLRETPEINLFHTAFLVAAKNNLLKPEKFQKLPGDVQERTLHQTVSTTQYSDKLLEHVILEFTALANLVKNENSEQQNKENDKENIKNLNNLLDNFEDGDPQDQIVPLLNRYQHNLDDIRWHKDKEEEINITMQPFSYFVKYAPLEKVISLFENNRRKFDLDELTSMESENAAHPHPLNITLIQHAARWGNLTNLQWLLKQNANPNKPDSNGNILWHHAIFSQDLYFIQQLVKLGILKKEDINTYNHEGITPLHLAVLIDNTEIIKLVIEQGADLRLPNQDGLTPFNLITGYMWHSDFFSFRPFLLPILSFFSQVHIPFLSRVGISFFSLLSSLYIPMPYPSRIHNEYFPELLALPAIKRHTCLVERLPPVISSWVPQIEFVLVAGIGIMLGLLCLSLLIIIGSHVAPMLALLAIAGLGSASAIVLIVSVIITTALFLAAFHLIFFTSPANLHSFLSTICSPFSFCFNKLKEWICGRREMEYLYVRDSLKNDEFEMEEKISSSFDTSTSNMNEESREENGDDEEPLLLRNKRSPTDKKGKEIIEDEAVEEEGSASGVGFIPQCN